jgi:hypothetical protein
MIKNILKLGLVAPLILIFFSCDDNFDLTLDLQRDPLLNTTYTDTLTVTTSVVKLDSVNTTKQMLAGSVADSRFGTTRATFFSKVTLGVPGRDTLRLSASATAPVFDSAVLILPVNARYGDTTVAQRFMAHQLTERLDPSRSYYQFEQLRTGQLLGQTPERARLANNNLRISLNPELGQDIFQRAANSATAPLIGQDRFEELLNGIRVSATAQAGAAIYSFDIINSRLAIFYRNTAADTTRRSLDLFLLDPVGDNFGNISFPLDRSRGQAFSNLQADLGRSRFLANLARQRRLPTSATGNEAYLQAGVGIGTHVQFPGILNLRRPNTRMIINRAILSMHTTASNYEPERANQPPPLSLILVYADRDARVVRNADGSDRYLIQEYTRGANGVFPRGETPYNNSARNYPDIDITTYLQQVVNGRTPNHGIIFKTTQFTNSVSKLLFGDQRAPVPAERIQLKVNYTLVND